MDDITFYFELVIVLNNCVTSTLPTNYKIKRTITHRMFSRKLLAFKLDFFLQNLVHCKVAVLIIMA